MNLQEAIQDLPFNLELADNDRVIDAVVLMRVHKMDIGETRFTMASSATIDPIITAGLLSSGQAVFDMNWEEEEET